MLMIQFMFHFYITLIIALFTKTVFLSSCIFFYNGLNISKRPLIMFPISDTRAFGANVGQDA